MAEFIEGKRPIIEAIRTGVPLKKILMADGIKRDPLVNDILRKAKRKEVPVIMVPNKELDEKSARGSHQGVIAEAAPFAYAGIGEIVDAANHQAERDNGSALVVVLDHITDAGNFGAIVRSAETVGAAGVVIPNKRSVHVGPTTYKSSAGAISHVPVAQVSNLVQALERLKKDGFWVVAATEYSHDVIWDVNMKGKVALVMGNEAEGVSRLVLEHCDLMGKLPVRGDIASLNVAQAATAVMYEWLRQNR